MFSFTESRHIHVRAPQHLRRGSNPFRKNLFYARKQEPSSLPNIVVFRDGFIPRCIDLKAGYACYRRDVRNPGKMSPAACAFHSSISLGAQEILTLASLRVDMIRSKQYDDRRN